MKGLVSNPELYERMSEPYTDGSAAVHALRAFLDEVKELREKHRIPEIVVGAGVYSANGDGVVMSSTFCQFGNAVRVFGIVEEIRSELAIAIVQEGVKADMKLKEKDADKG